MYVYVIIKTMFPPGCHHNDFVATHALGRMNCNHVPGPRNVFSTFC